MAFTTINDVYTEFSAMHGTEHPVWSLEQLRDWLQHRGISYRDVDSDVLNDAIGAETEALEEEVMATRIDGAKVAEKLGITVDELNSMYTAVPVRGEVGTEVAARIADRFGLDVSEPLGQQLASSGVLTDDEAAWLDDEP